MKEWVARVTAINWASHRDYYGDPFPHTPSGLDLDKRVDRNGWPKFQVQEIRRFRLESFRV